MSMHMNKNVCKCLKINDYKKKKKIIKDINNNNKKEGKRERENSFFISTSILFSLCISSTSIL